jgi:hypothetical protein
MLKILTNEALAAGLESTLRDTMSGHFLMTLNGNSVIHTGLASIM